MKDADEFENLAALVAVGKTVREACESLGLSESKAYRCTAKPEFKARVHVIRTEKTEGLSALALDAAEDAIRELRVLATTAEKDADRISACDKIIKQVLPLAENTELRRRLDDLERRAAEADSEAGAISASE